MIFTSLLRLKWVELFLQFGCGCLWAVPYGNKVCFKNMIKSYVSLLVSLSHLMLFSHMGRLKDWGALRAAKVQTKFNFCMKFYINFQSVFWRERCFFSGYLARARARPSRARWASGPCPQRGVNIFLGGARMLFLFSFFRREAPCGGGKLADRLCKDHSFRKMSTPEVVGIFPPAENHFFFFLNWLFKFGSKPVARYHWGKVQKRLEEKCPK